MLKWYITSPKQRSLQLLKKRKDGALLCVQEPTEEEIRYLSTRFALEEGMIVDALDPEEVPRAEYLDGVLYLFIRVPILHDGILETEPVLCAVTEHHCSIVSQARVPFLEKALSTDVFTTTEPITCMLQIMFAVAVEYDLSITRLNKNLYRLRKSIEKITSKQILDFVTSEEQMNDVLNSLLRILLALRSLFGHKKIILTEDQSELFEDLVLELDQLVISAKNNLRSIKNTHDAYTAIMTNNLNKEIKLFTSLTVILTIPTIISSFFGMNVRLPLQDHSLGFLAILVLTTVVVGSLLFLFNKNDWL